MSEIRYEVHPKIFRMRPVATLVVLLVMLAGVVLVGAGEPLAARLAVPVSGQNMQYIGVSLFGLACLQVFIWYAPTRFTRFTITDDSLLLVRGFLNKQTTEVSMDSVRTLQITQGLLQRMTDVCDVAVFTTGDLPEIVVRGMPDPERIRELVKARAAVAAA